MREGDKSMKITALGGDVAYLGQSNFFIKSEDGVIEKK